MGPGGLEAFFRGDEFSCVGDFADIAAMAEADKGVVYFEFYERQLG